MLPLKDIWKKACEYISEEISSPVAYRTWIGESYPYRVKGNVLYFSVPTEINKNMIEKRYSDLIVNSILEVTGEKYTLEVTIGEINDEVSESKEKEETKESGDEKKSTS